MVDNAVTAREFAAEICEQAINLTNDSDSNETGLDLNTVDRFAIDVIDKSIQSCLEQGLLNPGLYSVDRSRTKNSVIELFCMPPAIDGEVNNIASEKFKLCNPPDLATFDSIRIHACIDEKSIQRTCVEIAETVVQMIYNKLKDSLWDVVGDNAQELYDYLTPRLDSQIDVSKLLFLVVLEGKSIILSDSRHAAALVKRLRKEGKCLNPLSGLKATYGARLPLEQLNSQLAIEENRAVLATVSALNSDTSDIDNKYVTAAAAIFGQDSHIICPIINDEDDLKCVAAFPDNDDTRLIRAVLDRHNEAIQDIVKNIVQREFTKRSLLLQAMDAFKAGVEIEEHAPSLFGVVDFNFKGTKLNNLRVNTPVYKATIKPKNKD